MTSYKIYPSIGIARVGNAPAKFYIGPEEYRTLPTCPSGEPIREEDLRDEAQRMCRQAARFRIYRHDDDGDSEELTLDSANVKSIIWTAHLANKKASWYEFLTTLGEKGYAPNHPWRNPTVTDRQSLMIDAGPRTISGKSQHGVDFSADTAPPGYKGVNFPAGPLEPTQETLSTLGELRTDPHGRLLVLGGHGISGTTEKQASITNYANNDNWYDDTSDGPVFADIEFKDGTRVRVEPAWVIVGPPAYAPEIPNLVTLYDTIFDSAVRHGARPDIYSGGIWNVGPEGFRPAYERDIRPLLERATLYPWVTAIPPKVHRFDLEHLGQVPPDGVQDEFKSLRRWILDVLRPPDSDNAIVSSSGRTMMPYLAGDNALQPGAPMSTYLRLTSTQYFMLQQWAAGYFTIDTEPPAPGDALTKGVLENCVGGAFSPGIEMTWISRNRAIYNPGDAFRINAKLVKDGPLSSEFDPAAMEPGDVTRYMAVPWQADFNECSSQPIDGRVLWWWPSQRPEFVYLEHAPPELKVKGLSSIPEPPTQESGVQVAWIGTDFDQTRSDFIQFADDVSMVEYWSQLGFVIEKEIDGEQRFVEVERTLPRPFMPK